MKKKPGIVEIIKEINTEIKTNSVSEEKLHYYLEVIQKERLFHLIVTMFTAVFCILFLGLFLILKNIAICVLFLILLVLVSFYLGYYYRLENTAIEWEMYLGENKYK